MKLLRAVFLGLVATAQASRLVQFPVNRDNYAILPRAILDHDNIEELTSTYAKVWADDAEIKKLEKFGFNVQTEGVEDTTKINAMKALQQPHTQLLEFQEPNWSEFMNYPAMEQFLLQLDAQCSMYKLQTIGQTYQGREIYVMEIVGNSGPEVLMAGNIHGDETTGGQLLLHFLWDLCHKTATDARLAQIIASVHLFVMPMFNPDGYMNRRRGNANRADLNRDFPNQFTSPTDSPAGRQIETQHMMEFTSIRNFRISLMFHGGALVANYAYDSVAPGTPSGTYSATDRDPLVRQLALDYSLNHTRMPTDSGFPQGIVNGAQWYVIYGSLQDFMYDYRGCIDLTLEVSSTKWPNGSRLPGFYSDNYNSLVTYILNVFSV